jgi:CrcB protein
MNILIVFIGGGIGATLRYATINFIKYLSTKTSLISFYHSVIIVNLIGSILFAVILSIHSKFNIENDNIKLFFFTGIIASYTTFSTFVFESFEIYFEKGLLQSLYYFSSSILISFISFYIIYKMYVQN